MGKYTVKIYKGDYTSRQRAANRDGAICYAEQHFNSSSDPQSNCSLAIVATNASKKSKDWGLLYANLVDKEFPEVPRLCGLSGLSVGGYDGRGNGNLVLTNMPAILCEPMFASNPRHAETIRSDDGRSRLAKCLVDSITQMFPSGGLVALSIGHLYKTSKPHDKGAELVGGGTEGEYAEKVILKAKEMLEAIC